MSEKLRRSTFIQWNAVLISRAASWQHSLLCPWPDDPKQDANARGGVERYLQEMREVLSYIEQEAGLTEAGHKALQGGENE